MIGKGVLDPAVSVNAFSASDPLVVTAAMIGLALLIIILLFLSYFTVLRAIAAYSYSNARFKAVGTPFLSRPMLESLSESTNLLDLSSRLSEYDYRVPQGPRVSIEELEEALETETIRMLRNTLAATPDGSKPFFRAYLVRMDSLQVKKALRAVRTGRKPNVHPAYYVDANMVRLLAEAPAPQDVAEMVGDNFIGQALAEAVQQNPDEPVLWEMAIDRAAFKNIYGSIALLDDEIRAPIREFYGRMADVYNINLLARAKSLGIIPSEVLSWTAQGGRELAQWRLEQLAETQDFQTFVSELDSTSYGAYMKEKGLNPEQAPELEHALDWHMLDMVSELASKNTLLAGPALKFAFGKEREARNIMAVARAVADGVGFADVEHFLIAEASR